MYRDEMWAMFREERVLVSCLPMLEESMSGKKDILDLEKDFGKEETRWFEGKKK